MTYDDDLRWFHATLLRIHPYRDYERPAEPDRAAEAALVAAVRDGRLGARPGDTLMPPRELGNWRSTALDHMANSPYVDLVRAFLETGSDVNQRGGRVECPTPLIDRATARGATALTMVRLLVDHGADVRAADANGWTALHSAVSHVSEGALEMIRYLLEKGADPLARTSVGETPLSIATLKCAPSAPRDALLRASALNEMAKRKPRTLTFRKRKEGIDLTRDVGIDALASYVRSPELGWVFLAVRAPIEDTSRALSEAFPGARVERDCAKRHVEDGAFSCFVTRLVPAEWTLVLYGSSMLVKLELSQRIQAHGATVAKTLGVEVVAAIGKRVVVEYAAGGAPTMHEYGEDELYYAGAKTTMLELLRAKQILVPPFNVTSNGLTIELVLHGVTKELVERLDAVVFEQV